MKLPFKLLSASGLALAALCRTLPLWAQPDQRWPELVVSGTCPQESGVRALLSTLVPNRGTAPPGLPSAATVADLDKAFVVAVGARSKTYADPARDCAQRSRIAAAFIALALLPEGAEPAAPASPPPPALPPPTPPELPVLPVVASSTWASLDARGALALGFAPVTRLTPGVVVHAAAGRGVLGGHLSCGWVFGTSIALAQESGSVLIERLPCDAGPTLRFFTLGHRFDTAIDAGFAVGLLRAFGRGFDTNPPSSRVELGVRIAVDTALHADSARASLQPILGLEVTAYATGYDFNVAPHGDVGQAPLVWAAITAGIRWGADFGP